MQECGRNRDNFGTYLPRRACRLIVRVLPLHRSIYLPNRQPFARAAEDRAAQYDWKSVLGSPIGVREACECVRAIGMGLMSAHHDLGTRGRAQRDAHEATSLEGLFYWGGGRAGRCADGLESITWRGDACVRA